MGRPARFGQQGSSLPLIAGPGVGGTADRTGPEKKPVRPAGDGGPRFARNIAMAALIVLFNLKPGVTEADYEAFATTLDVPTVKGLKSVADFRVFRMSGVMGTEGLAPYRYVEVIDFSSMDELGADIGGSPAMGEITTKFGELADAVFMLGEAFV